MNYKDIAEVVWKAIFAEFEKRGEEPRFMLITTGLHYGYKASAHYWRQEKARKERAPKESAAKSVSKKAAKAKDAAEEGTLVT